MRPRDRRRTDHRPRGAQRLTLRRVGPPAARPEAGCPQRPGTSAVAAKQSEFPASWTVDETTELSDTFGYFKYHVFDEGLGFDPIVCFGVVGVASTGAFDAAQVFGHDPAAQVAVADGKDILLTVGREFDRSGFDAFVGLVSRCLRFGSAVAGSYTVRILEDSRPTAGPQRFRYSLTTTISAEPADETRTDYYSYGRTSGLILTGSAGSGHQQALDALFDITLQRIVER